MCEKLLTWSSFNINMFLCKSVRFTFTSISETIQIHTFCDAKANKVSKESLKIIQLFQNYASSRETKGRTKRSYT